MIQVGGFLEKELITTSIYLYGVYLLEHQAEKPRFMGSMPIGFGEGARAAFLEMYNKAIEHGIITRLE